MTNDSPPATPERNFAAQFRRLREARGLTQTDVADLADEYGLSLRQQQVAKIEAGIRPLRLDEAAVLARIVQEDLATLLTPELSRPELRARIRERRSTVRALEEELPLRERERDDAAAALKLAEREVTRVLMHLASNQQRLDAFEKQLSEKEG